MFSHVKTSSEILISLLQLYWLDLASSATLFLNSVYVYRGVLTHSHEVVCARAQSPFVAAHISHIIELVSIRVH